MTAIRATFAVVLLSLAALAVEDKVLCDFEGKDTVVCSGGAISTTQAATGKASYLWKDHQTNPRLNFAGAAGDWSAWNTLSFRLYSEKANNAKFVIIVSSENPETEGPDYYLWNVTVDWEGWESFDLLYESLRPSRQPLGWGKITGFSWSASGWYNTPQPDTAVAVDDVRLRYQTDLDLLKPDAVSERLRTHLRAGHPRLFLTDERLADLKRQAETDETLQAYVATVIRQAEAQIDAPDVPYGCDGKYYMLDKSRRVLRHVTYLALAYRWTGRKEFATSALRQMRAACEFPDWHAVHFLDTAELANALGIGYDWLYHVMSPEQRKMVRTTLVEKALHPGLTVYRRQGGWHTGVNNWNQVCNGGLAIAALAVAEDEFGTSAMILQNAVRSLPVSLASYAPDGGWYEGPGYWQFAATYLNFGLGAMESALGTEFDLGDSPGLSATALFPITMSGPTDYAFNYADCGAGRRGPRACLFRFAQRYNLPAVADNEHAFLKASKFRYATPWHVIWYQPPAGSTARLPLDSHYGGVIDVVGMRSGWNDPLALWVAMKVGANNVSHAHLDVGSFVLDALGQRFVCDLGADSYLLPGYFDARSGKRWTYYRLSSDSHNVPKLGDTTQDPKEGGSVVRYEHNSEGGLFVADLTPVYAAKASSVRRGIAMLPGRRGVLVRDEIALPAPTSVLWGFTTYAEIDVSDLRRAVLTRNGKQLVVTLQAPAGAVFTVASAERPPPENQNKGAKRLQVSLPDARGKIQVAVKFTPVYAVSDPMESAGFAGPLKDWKLPPEVQDRLAGIRLGDAPLAAFRPDQYTYHDVMPAGEALPTVTATAADGKPVQISTSGTTCPALVKIQPAGGPEYRLHFVVGPPTKAVLKATVKGIRVSATDAVPGYGPANTLDDDLDTRWSAEGDPQTLTYDFGKLRKVQAVRIAHFKGDERTLRFQIRFSQDGKAWDTIFDGSSSGQTADYQTHALNGQAARWVQLVCHGNSDSAWNSITGVKFDFGE